MLPSPRRASDNRIDGRKQILRSPGGRLNKNTAEEKTVDNFDLFSGAINNNDPWGKVTRSASVGCDPASMRKRAASPKRGSARYLAPVQNPHQVKTVFSTVKESSSGEETSDEKNDHVNKTNSQKTDILPMMYQGMKIYKFGKKNSKPKLKTVFLSKDNKHLKWSSQLKKADKKQVEIASITRVEGGMKSEVFDQVMHLPRDASLSLNPNLAISIYYDAGSNKTKTLNMVATVRMHQQIWIEGLRKFSKVCRSGGNPENIIEIFINITSSAEDHDTTSLMPAESKSFRWEKINPDQEDGRPTSPSRECVEITTGSGVTKRPYSKSLPSKPNFLAKSWV